MEQEVRCFCARHPLLAVGLVDTKTRQPVLHVKSFRGDRIFTELVVEAGTVRIRCRECLRWHTVRIRPRDLDVAEEPLPDSIPLKKTSPNGGPKSETRV